MERSRSDDVRQAEFLALARELKAAGHSVDEVLGALRAAGAYAIPSIKVLRAVYGFTLAEAKDRLETSSVWADQVPEWDRLHEELARAFLEYGREAADGDRESAG